MSNGKSSVPLPERQLQAGIPETYLACARWLLKNPAVLEVWSLASDLPEIGTPEASVTLDAGIWFLCRVDLPPVDEGEGILSFIPQYRGQG